MAYDWHYSWWIFPFLCIGAMMVFMLLMQKGQCFGTMHSGKERDGVEELTKEVAALRKEIEALDGSMRAAK